MAIGDRRRERGTSENRNVDFGSVEETGGCFTAAFTIFFNALGWSPFSAGYSCRRAVRCRTEISTYSSSRRDIVYSSRIANSNIPDLQDHDLNILQGTISG